MGRPRGSQHLAVAAVVGTWRRVNGLRASGMSTHKAMLTVAEETRYITSRGAVEYRYKIGAEFGPYADALARAMPAIRAFGRGDWIRAVQNAGSLLSNIRK